MIHGTPHHDIDADASPIVRLARARPASFVVVRDRMRRPTFGRRFGAISFSLAS